MQIKDESNPLWSPTASSRLLRCFIADAISHKAMISIRVYTDCHSIRYEIENVWYSRQRVQTVLNKSKRNFWKTFEIKKMFLWSRVQC